MRYIKGFNAEFSVGRIPSSIQNIIKWIVNKKWSRELNGATQNSQTNKVQHTQYGAQKFGATHYGAL